MHVTRCHGACVYGDTSVLLRVGHQLRCRKQAWVSSEQFGRVQRTADIRRLLTAQLGHTRELLKPCMLLYNVAGFERSEGQSLTPCGQLLRSRRISCYFLYVPCDAYSNGVGRGPHWAVRSVRQAAAARACSLRNWISGCLAIESGGACTSCQLACGDFQGSCNHVTRTSLSHELAAEAQDSSLVRTG
ncbi:hypothetical protein FVE85_0006 [Porphyridium purpureum]|uniref:Uncharacterized protein n=1 Tax=Porphyridium purpureum TaxID=35688 RepID=A0A5J4Z0S5_PORPP|nr:hypothetical protein FVE85_0006 [Porphyridium purpureum]|eukprot:POR2524..scf208_2